MKMKYDEIGQAGNPGGMGVLPGVPVQPTDKLTAVDAAINQKVEAMNGRYPWKNGSPVVTVPASVETGYATSEGVPIESSFRYADDFYNQMGINNILDNTPSGAMSYQGYLAYNGITDPRINYVRALDRANEMYARSLGTYGASGESLAQGNLVGTGYSEYLNGLAYQNKANMYTAAAQQLSADQRQTAAQYQQYLRDYEKENGISVPGAAQGGTPGGVSVESSAAVLTPAQQQAYDYLSGNVTLSSDIPAAIIAMRSQGLSDADIEAALNNWNAYRTEGINTEIDNVSSLAAGNIAKLKEVYGEGAEYEAAAERLRQRNDKLINSVVDSIVSGNLDSEEFINATKALRENTAYEDKKGNTAYNWDEMSDGDRIRAVKGALTDMYNQGDISEETYQKANYRLIDDSLSTDMNAKYFIGAGKKRLKDILEDVAIMDAEPGSVSDEQRREILQKAAGSITGVQVTSGSGGARGYSYDESRATISINGKNMSAKASSGQVTSREKVGDKYVTKVVSAVQTTDKNGLFSEDGKIYFGQNGIKYALTFDDLSDPQRKALIEILSINK